MQEFSRFEVCHFRSCLLLISDDLYICWSLSSASIGLFIAAIIIIIIIVVIIIARLLQCLLSLFLLQRG